MAKHTRNLIIAVTLLGAALAYARGAHHEAPVAEPAAASQDGVSVWFSPKGGCTAAVVGEIDSARKSLHVQAYSFTSSAIARAVIAAKQRGVQITVVFDASQRTEKYSSATFLSNAGIATFIDDKHAIAHNKVMLIDGRSIITGSFNFTTAAEEHNAENLVVIHDRAGLCAAYEKNFQEHLAHSTRYDRPD